MTPFDKFIASFRPREDGWRIFEHFSKWFLENDPFWSSQVKKVWLWDDWPGRWGPDSGIDLIFEHIDGSLWAVQSKFYDSDYSLKKADIDSFLSESSRKEIQHRLLIATTDKLGSKASKTIYDQEKPVVFFGLEAFKNSSVSYPDSYQALNKANVRKKFSPLPHQKTAINDVVRGFERADRGQLIMPCGTGKTYTTLWVKEELKANLTLVLLPSLSLLSQTMIEWVGACRDKFRVLNVCSDKSVGRKDESVGLDSFSYPVTSDVSVIRDFMSVTEPGVIFSTYQSSPLISDAQTSREIPHFDFIVADEAHRCVGMAGSSFTTVLDGTAIRATKRLFTTATPRFFAKQVLSRAKEMDIEPLGMDNEEVFGRRLHSLPFGKAIDLGLLADYQVAIVGVDDVTVRQFIENRINFDVGDTVQDAESLSAQVAILKALKKYNLDRVITFHSRVNSAREFSETLPKLMDTHEALMDTDYTLWTSFVSGKQNAHQRRQTIDFLRELPNTEKGLLANARCLSEGVDVPALDGIAFVDPKASQIDIIQAVGRVLRLSAHKTKGTIIIPVFISSDESHEVVLNDSSFKTVWEIIKALRSHDETLADALDKYRTELGRVGKLIDYSLDDKLIVDLPSCTPAWFFHAIKTRLVENTTTSWEFMFGLLQKYIEENGDALVPVRFSTATGVNLGHWVSDCRVRRGELSASRTARLNEVGFVWDVEEYQWEKMFSELECYVKEHGDAMVPKEFKTDSGTLLGSWVSNIRNGGRSQLSESRLSRLSEIGFVWNTRVFKWEAMYSELQSYLQDNGDTLVPHNYETDSGIRLGQWVKGIRSGGFVCSDAQRTRLDTIGFVWNVEEYQWEKMFSELECYVKEHGDALVPMRFSTPTGVNLGQWVIKHRIQARRRELSASRIARLNEVGFVWDVEEYQWEKMFSEYECYVGDKRSSYRTKRSNKLHRWIETQKENRRQGNLDPERERRLTEIGFTWYKME